MKKLLLTSLIFISTYYSYGQAGAKWATGGNSIGTGDFLGTTNNFPLLFKTNNAQKMQLSSSGVLQINNLIGTGNRLIQTDAGGNIISFAMGTSAQVLYGNGTWGSLPAAPSPLWHASGGNIYYNSGNVGIGTSTPFTALDVVGDARISNNLYVGGGIIISDKVNANTQVTTSRMVADSIVTDSTKGFYGTSKFNGNVKLQSKLNVDGATTIGGTLKVLGGLTITPVGPISVDPCINLISIDPLTNVITPLYASAIEAAFDASGATDPCPTIAIPFTWGTYGNHVNNNLRWIGTIENFDFRIKTFNTLRMIVKKDGKVGIGTDTPQSDLDLHGDILISGDRLHVGSDGSVGIGTNLPSNPYNYKLAVNGSIGAKEMKIESTSGAWPDYVFEKNYKLLSLVELQE